MSQAQVNSHLQLPFPKSHAFIVGIYDYEYVSKLTSAISDERALGHRLEEQHGYTVHGRLSEEAEIPELAAEDVQSFGLK